MQTIQMNWAGGLKFTGVSAFGLPITTDVAAEAGGEASGYRPSELLLFAVASCTGVDVVRILAKQRQELTSLEIEVIGTNGDTYPKPYHTVEIKYRATGRNLDPEKLRQAIALSEEKYCMVSQTLKFETNIKTSFEIVPAPDESNSSYRGLIEHRKG